MKVKEIVEFLKSLAVYPVVSDTVDTIKYGSENEEVFKIGVTLFPHYNVIKEAKDNGVNLLICHEPLFYRDDERPLPYGFIREKEMLIKNSGMTIFRFHDHAHCMSPDLIFNGQMNALGLKGEYVKGKYFGVNRFILQKSITTIELAKMIERKWKIKHVRIAGSRDNIIKTISCGFGSTFYKKEELIECDTFLCGECCEWSDAEFVRDFSLIERNKSIIVLGHSNSEEAGMKLLTKILKDNFPCVETEYFASGDVFSYTNG